MPETAPTTEQMQRLLLRLMDQQDLSRVRVARLTGCHASTVTFALNGRDGRWSQRTHRRHLDRMLEAVCDYIQAQTNEEDDA